MGAANRLSAVFMKCPQSERWNTNQVIIYGHSMVQLKNYYIHEIKTITNLLFLI